jgi:hypothetical protein
MTCGGWARSSHVSPRSRERNSRVLPTDIQTIPSPAAATNATLGRGFEVALTTGDGSTGDEPGVDAVDVGTAANVDGGAALGVALGVALGADGTGAHAEPSKAMAVNQQRIGTSIAGSQAGGACAIAENAYVRGRSYGVTVARSGFEPLISALRGLHPRPLDERAGRQPF